MDITDRLRAPVSADDAVSVVQLQAAAEMAADEIERLRAEVEALRTMLTQAERDIEEMPAGCGCADDI